MTATITLTGNVANDWHVVKLADGQDFELLVKAPSYADRLKDSELAGRLVDDGRWLQHRIESTVYMWSQIDLGETGDGTNEFTHARLALLCNQCPEVYRQVLQLVDDAWKIAALPKDAAKN